jgi:threonine dehydrogenase-like Zn-dependent dehydrogenase
MLFAIHYLQYNNDLPSIAAGAVKPGDVFGHEAVGVIDAVGFACTKVRTGQRVVIQAVIACGQCDFCKEGRTSLCDCTNPS